MFLRIIMSAEILHQNIKSRNKSLLGNLQLKANFPSIIKELFRACGRLR